MFWYMRVIILFAICCSVFSQDWHQIKLTDGSLISGSIVKTVDGVITFSELVVGPLGVTEVEKQIEVKTVKGIPFTGTKDELMVLLRFEYEMDGGDTEGADRVDSDKADELKAKNKLQYAKNKLKKLQQTLLDLEKKLMKLKDLEKYGKTIEPSTKSEIKMLEKDVIRNKEGMDKAVLGGAGRAIVAPRYGTRVTVFGSERYLISPGTSEVERGRIETANRSYAAFNAGLQESSKKLREKRSYLKGIQTGMIKNKNNQKKTNDSIKKTKSDIKSQEKLIKTLESNETK